MESLIGFSSCVSISTESKGDDAWKYSIIESALLLRSLNLATAVILSLRLQPTVADDHL